MGKGSGGGGRGGGGGGFSSPGGSFQGGRFSLGSGVGVIVRRRGSGLSAQIGNNKPLVFRRSGSNYTRQGQALRINGSQIRFENL